MGNISAQVLELSKQLTDKLAPEAHHSAVLAQLAFANEIFEGLGVVCEKGKRLSGETLRTLFEAAASTIILDHKRG